MEVDSIFNYIRVIFPPVIVSCLVIAIVVFQYYNSIKEMLGDFLHVVGFGLNFVDKQASSYRLEGKIGNSIQKITDNKFIIPHGIEVNWKNGETKETFLHHNKVVVVLNKDESEEKQFVRAVMEFIRCGLIPASKVRLESNVINASDIKVAQSIISTGSPQTVGYFEDMFLKPFFNREELKRLLYDNLVAIEKSGMLYQMLLNEYEDIANQTLCLGPNNILVDESIRFFHFVCSIATKKPGQMVPLSFKGQYFKVAVILATRDDGYWDNLGNYVSVIQNLINEGILKIYIYALGRKVECAREIAALTDSIDGRICNITYQKYVRLGLYGKYIEGICIELNVNKVGY